MTASRFGGFSAAAVEGLAEMYLTTGNASADDSSTSSTSETPSSVPPTTAPATELATSATVAACEVTAADVDGGTATFTVGPDGCTTEVGPISFSTYALPGGDVLPYEDQVLIAHAAENGSFYAAGLHTLTASLGDAMNWQADLYFGESDNQPPHPNMIAVDAQTGHAATTTQPCTILDSDVESGMATFTVGPDGCSPKVGPISFSTYALPNGQILPYAEQVLIAHSTANGSFYGAGSYTLTASLGDAINWQSDLYFGESDNQPPHPHMIDVDAQMGQVAPASGTVAPTTAPTTAPPTTTPETTVAAAPPITVIANASANATVVVTPSEQVAQAGPTTTTTVGPVSTLPATGSNSTPVMLTTAGALTVVGLATRRLARGH